MLALAGCSDLGRPVLLTPRGDLSATALDFGSVAVLDSATRSLTLHNSGTADLVGAVTLSCPGFSIAVGGGAFSLAPGATLVFLLRFKPSTEGTYSCTLDLGPDTPHVSLVGMSVFQEPGAQCAVVPDTLDFDFVPTSQTVFRTFKAFSVGTAPLRVNVVSPCGEITPLAGAGPTVLAPGDSLTVNLLFSPRIGGPFTCTIDVGPRCPTVRVRGFATTVSFASDVQPIFDTHCVRCHRDPNLTGFGVFPALDAVVSYGNLVNVPSPAYEALRVKPFDPDSSVLYGKINNSRRYGSLMPWFGPLIPQAQREKIKTWILEGALNN